MNLSLKRFNWQNIKKTVSLGVETNTELFSISDDFLFFAILVKIWNEKKIFFSKFITKLYFACNPARLPRYVIIKTDMRYCSNTVFIFKMRILKTDW